MASKTNTPTPTPSPAVDVATLLSSALNPNRGQDLILQEIISVLQNLKCDEFNLISIQRLIKGLLSRVPYIVLILLFHHYVGNTKDLVQGLTSLLWRLTSSGIYRTKRYSQADLRSVEFFQSEAFLRLSQPVYTFGIPMYITRVNQEQTVRSGATAQQTAVIEIQYVPWIHSKVLAECEDAGERVFNEVENGSNYYLYSDNAYRSHQYGQLFPSDNYTRLSNMIQDHVDVESSSKYFRVLGLLINGMPGLGKSKFAEYIASTNIISNVYRVDLNQMQFLTQDPTTLFKSIFTSISVVKTSLFMIDELDKWLAEYIERSYTKLQNDAARNSMKQNTNSNNPNQASNQPSNSSTPLDPILVPSKDEHEKKIKRDLFLALLAVVDRVDIRNSCVVIFCCNNFDTIFDGIVMTHYTSLDSRLPRIDFYPCHSKEISAFYRYYNERFKTSDRTARFYRPDIDTILANLKPEVQLTYRKLSEVSTKWCYNYETIVKVLNTDHCHILSENGSPIISQPKNKGKCRKSERSVVEPSKTLVDKRSVYKADTISKADIEESALAASSGSNISQPFNHSENSDNIANDNELCFLCEEEVPAEIYNGMSLCISCIEDDSVLCWVCKKSNSVEFVLDKYRNYYWQGDGDLLVWCCNDCLPQARIKWPDYIVHNIVNCACDCDDYTYIRPTTPDRMKFNMCYNCNGLWGTTKSDRYEIDEEDLNCLTCELCKTKCHPKIFYCPEIDSNCCEKCSMGFINRKELVVNLDTNEPMTQALKKEKPAKALKKEKPAEALAQESKTSDIKLVDLPEPGLCSSLTIIHCNTCDIWSLDPEPLTCECCPISKKKEDVVEYEKGLTITICNWDQCRRCVHGAKAVTILDIYPNGSFDSPLVVSDKNSLIELVKQMMDDIKNGKSDSSEVIRCIYTVFQPCYHSLLAKDSSISILSYSLGYCLVRNQAYTRISQYQTMVQQTLMLDWKAKKASIPSNDTK